MSLNSRSPIVGLLAAVVLSELSKAAPTKASGSPAAESKQPEVSGWQRHCGALECRACNADFPAQAAKLAAAAAEKSLRASAVKVEVSTGLAKEVGMHEGIPAGSPEAKVRLAAATMLSEMRACETALLMLRVNRSAASAKAQAGIKQALEGFDEMLADLKT